MEIEKKMDWKAKINEWSREYEIPPPTFLLTTRELKRILLRGVLKWQNFTEQYPSIFDSALKGERIKNELRGIYAKLVCNSIFGEVAGVYNSVRDIEITILAIDDRRKNGIVTLRHEWFHHFAEIKELFLDDDFSVDEEVYADRFGRTGRIDKKLLNAPKRNGGEN